MRRITLVSLCLLVLFQLLVAQEKPTLAVLDFDAFGLSEPEVAALTNRLRTNMAQLGQYRIIERGMMEQVLLEQDFQLTGCISDECAVEVGQLLGAQFMLAGSIGTVGNTWTVEMRIIDVETGEVIRSASYDTQGIIDVVLTEGMGAAARRISGVEIEASAPAVALRPGILDVLTDPVGGVIFVNDIDRGTTRVAGLELPPGASYAISVRLDRYHDLDTTVALEAGERVRLNLALEPMMGYLAFSGDAGARIKIGGKAVATTPTENVLLQMGTYPVAISKPTYYTFTANPTVLYEHTTTVDYVLRPKPRAPAVLLSTALPGAGQLYHGQRRGLLYLAASASLAWLGYSQQVVFQDHESDYQARLADYNRETDLTLALQKKALVQESFDAMKAAEQQRNIFLGAVGGMWTLNLVDIIF